MKHAKFSVSCIVIFSMHNITCASSRHARQNNIHITPAQAALIVAHAASSGTQNNNAINQSHGQQSQILPTRTQRRRTRQQNNTTPPSSHNQSENASGRQRSINNATPPDTQNNAVPAIPMRMPTPHPAIELENQSNLTNARSTSPSDNIPYITQHNLDEDGQRVFILFLYN